MSNNENNHHGHALQHVLSPPPASSTQPLLEESEEGTRYHESIQAMTRRSMDLSRRAEDDSSGNLLPTCADVFQVRAGSSIFCDIIQDVMRACILPAAFPEKMYSKRTFRLFHTSKDDKLRNV